MEKEVQGTTVSSVVIRFAGDSGDGMQLTGSQFASAVAQGGSEIATLPDFPSEIRAPIGTTSGVSGFQIQFGDSVLTPGDQADILVAMNPAALKVNAGSIAHDGIIIIDIDAFDKKSLEKAGYLEHPVIDGKMDGRVVYSVPITSRTLATLDESSIPRKDRARCKNFFTLGILLWLHEHEADVTVTYLKEKFASKPELAEANIKVLSEGMLYAHNSGIFQSRYSLKESNLAPGTYRNLSGNQAIALGLIAAASGAGLEIFLGSYPITPATDILQELALHKNFGVRTYQAEDEIAGICSAIGAAFAGALAVTTTSGPGMSLKTEALGLAVISELPLIVINVQRGGPSTGLPTKTEQSDLLQALFGRHGECPLPVIATRSPADCFYQAIEASRIALKYMTPVILLSDGYLGNGSEPFQVPRVEDLPDLSGLKKDVEVEGFSPYRRDERTLARDWAIPGTPDLQHRIGGLEKDAVTGEVSHDPVNHEKMTHLRREKVERIAGDIPDLDIFGDQTGGDILLVSWGSTFGSIRSKVIKYREQGASVSHAHFTHLSPLPGNTGEVLGKFKHVVVAEMNLGQLDIILRARFLVDTTPLVKVQGKPFYENEIAAVVDQYL
jgi:2-oxoglutarate/2-oxoacid ferredoxin oxidoreductase subunit alpha